MNKSEMKTVLESIEKKINGDSRKYFSCMEHNNAIVWNVLKELYDDGHTVYEFNSVRYQITYYPAHPTIGGRTSTPEFMVKKYISDKIFNADELLSKKEINICHFHGGQPKGFEEPIELNGVDDVLRIVKHFYEETKLNIMVHRQSTGDVTIWLDDKRFQQR